MIKDRERFEGRAGNDGPDSVLKGTFIGGKRLLNYENLSFVNCYTSNTETEGSKFLSEGIRCMMKSS